MRGTKSVLIQKKKKTVEGQGLSLIREEKEQGEGHPRSSPVPPAPGDGVARCSPRPGARVFPPSPAGPWLRAALRTLGLVFRGKAPPLS